VASRREELSAEGGEWCTKVLKRQSISSSNARPWEKSKQSARSEEPMEEPRWWLISRGEGAIRRRWGTHRQLGGGGVGGRRHHFSAKMGVRTLGGEICFLVTLGASVTCFGFRFNVLASVWLFWLWLLEFPFLRCAWGVLGQVSQQRNFNWLPLTPDPHVVVFSVLHFILDRHPILFVS